MSSVITLQAPAMRRALQSAGIIMARPAAGQARSYTSAVSADARRKSPFAASTPSSASISPKSPDTKGAIKPKQWNQGYLAFLESKNGDKNNKAPHQV